MNYLTADVARKETEKQSGSLLTHCCTCIAWACVNGDYQTVILWKLTGEDPGGSYIEDTVRYLKDQGFQVQLGEAGVIDRWTKLTVSWRTP